jgi:hypothetical protein
MQQTRRAFIVTAASLAALSLAPARAASGPVRESLATFSTDQRKVDSLRKGVAAMKALAGSDHRSWFFQAATHAYGDALLDAELMRDATLKTFDKTKYWNKCPHFGQCSADFVIWHRAYLHFFERTLRAAANDPELALPYWNYGAPDQRTFPAIYALEFLDAAREAPNPLFHPNREKSFTGGLVEISALIGQAQKTVDATTFFHLPGAPGFGGDDLDEDHTLIGLLEQRPHNDIHLAVGGVINSANGAMAEITTAAFDPVFWAHHANVDRMWAEWAAKPGKIWGPVPALDWFDDPVWLFVDADGSEVHVSRRDAINLLAAYDVDYSNQLVVPPAPPPPPPPQPVASAPGSGPAAAPMPKAVGAAPPGAETVVATAGLRAARRPREREVLSDHRPIVVSPANSAHRLFGGPPPARARGNTRPTTETAAAQALNAPELADSNTRVLLELSGIVFTLVPSSGFAVYLDSAGQPASKDPVGLIDIFGATHHGAMVAMPGMSKATQRFDVTAIVRQSPGPFTLRVEPYDLLVTKSGTPLRARADQVQIGAVRFIVVS